MCCCRTRIRFTKPATSCLTEVEPISAESSCMSSSVPAVGGSLRAATPDTLGETCAVSSLARFAWALSSTWVAASAYSLLAPCRFLGPPNPSSNIPARTPLREHPAHEAVPDQRLTRTTSLPLPSSAELLVPLRNTLPNSTGLQQDLVLLPLSTSGRLLRDSNPCLIPVPTTTQDSIARQDGPARLHAIAIVSPRPSPAVHPSLSSVSILGNTGHLHCLVPRPAHTTL